MASQNSEVKHTILDTDIPLCSIAKREEEIFISSTKDPILFDK